MFCCLLKVSLGKAVADSHFLTFFSFTQITIDNCVEVEQIAKDLLLEDLLQNIGECYKTKKKTTNSIAAIIAVSYITIPQSISLQVT